MANLVNIKEQVSVLALIYLLLCLFITIGAKSNLEALLNCLEVGILYALVCIIVYSYYIKKGWFEHDHKR